MFERVVVYGPKSVPAQFRSAHIAHASVGAVLGTLVGETVGLADGALVGTGVGGLRHSTCAVGPDISVGVYPVMVPQSANPALSATAHTVLSLDVSKAWVHARSANCRPNCLSPHMGSGWYPPNAVTPVIDARVPEFPGDLLARYHVRFLNRIVVCGAGVRGPYGPRPFTRVHRPSDDRRTEPHKGSDLHLAPHRVRL